MKQCVWSKRESHPKGPRWLQSTHMWLCCLGCVHHLRVSPLHAHGHVICFVTQWISFMQRFFQKLGDFVTALQFLVLSKCNNEAYTMAEVRAGD